ncbi:hypothetical protein [Methyloversatilis universalis]|uniref:hypothetical protein n=1 Tax=Methyloversatilis universalis TaxID=378211 RepID=UPI000368CCB2|nr:hypothetical protein [Methyloversatilis universalis]
MQEFDFPWPNQEKGYRLFPAELEDDELVLFHATPKQNLPAILKEGFKARPPLASVSYAKSSIYCLAHLFTGRQSLAEEAVVIAVRFESLAQQDIKENFSDIHVYNSDIQPAILGHCTIPVTYEHK